MTQYVDERAVLARLESRVRDAGSAQALAAALGLSPQHLSDVRRGRRSVTGALAEALGVHVRRVFVEGPRPPEPVELADASGEVLVRAERVFS